MNSDYFKIKYSYDEIFFMLKRDKLPQDAIDRDWFAIYRGSLPIAHMLSIIHGHKDFGIIFPKQGKIIHPKVENNSALIIDDNVGEGKTLKSCYDLLDRYMYYSNIKLYLFLNDPNREIKPDYYCVNTKYKGTNYWVESPWEEFD